MARSLSRHPTPSSSRRSSIRKTSKSRSGSKNIAGSTPITTQTDVRVSRGRKRLSKKAVSWKKFVSKVHKAGTANEKTQFLHEYNSANLQVSGIASITKQEVVGTSAAATKSNLLLGSYGNNVTGPATVIQDLSIQPGASTVAGGTTGIAGNVKTLNYHVTFARANVSLENQSASSMFVDIYECIAAQHITDGAYASGQAAWGQCLSLVNTDYIGSFSNASQATTGQTPYSAPNFFKWWKIIKKTRIILQLNEKTNYLYYGKPHYVNNAKELGRYATKGVTKDLIIVANPTFSGDVAVINQLNIEWNKDYHMKVPGLAGTQTQFSWDQGYA